MAIKELAMQIDLSVAELIRRAIDRYLNTEAHELQKLGRRSSYTHRPILAKRLMEARKELEASGRPMLDWEDIERELGREREGF